MDNNSLNLLKTAADQGYTARVTIGSNKPAVFVVAMVDDENQTVIFLSDKGLDALDYDGRKMEQILQERKYIIAVSYSDIMQAEEN